MPRSLIQSSLLQRLSPVIRQEDGSFRATLTFDADFPGFDGHFPGNPIVPGVCELSLIELLAQLATHNDALRTKTIKIMKFRFPLILNDTVTIDFSIQQEITQTVISAVCSAPDKPNAAKIKLFLN